ncbi:MAG: hypothetical protein M3Q87_00045 [Actinomycetota bacterium]|nr:hypothetical protein [Actinomycetota bacterium]
MATGDRSAADPGPFDEAVGLVALGLIAVFYRHVLREIREDQRVGAPSP